MAYYERSYRIGFGGGLTQIVKYLLIINIAVFVLQKISPQDFLVQWFGLSPQLAIFKFHIWQFFTYMFLHAGFMHLLFNMLGLFFFGPRLEVRLGSRSFLTLYFLSGLGGALLSVLFAPNAAIVGASGAVFGVFLGFALF
ncbi:rhomboid family intramembrane serine protease, partial [candidate division KSB1 bacterium]|nr:rhomboid family intramembrane serine protease [candidate division KSB1 bacterium]